MPLYEAILITKAGTAQRSVYLLHHLLDNFLKLHPKVKIRDVQNIGDRIMAKFYKSEDSIHQIGRYL